MKPNQKALVEGISKEIIDSLLQRVEKNSFSIDKVVDELVAKHCSELDSYVLFVRECLLDKDRPPTAEELDDFVLNLPVLIYWAGDGQETLGIRQSIAEAIEKEAFNVAYEAANAGKNTINDKTAAAQQLSMGESITSIVYKRAFRKIKARVEIASELLTAVKKVISRRMQEYELSGYNPDKIKNN